MCAVQERSTPSVVSAVDHEKVILVQEPKSGLTGVIAIQSTALGPAVGGTRWRRYGDLGEAFEDALRLARAMTLKNAAAELQWGGGKACIIDDGSPRERQLKAYADLLNHLDGEFIAGKDVGMTLDAMNFLSKRTRWVVGVAPDHGGLGDPSPATAQTVLGAVQAALRIRFGSDELAGRSVAIVGVGSVGASLARQLTAGGAKLVLADIDEGRLRDAAKATGGEAVSIGEALGAKVDVLSPCATGEMIDTEMAERLRCAIIAGGANNPLVDDGAAQELHRRGVLYVPDYLANAGGVIMNAVEFNGEGPEALRAALERAVARTAENLRVAADTGRPPYEIAREAVEMRLKGDAS